jgi:hypothetical protein
MEGGKLPVGGGIGDEGGEDDGSTTDEVGDEVGDDGDGDEKGGDVVEGADDVVVAEADARDVIMIVARVATTDRRCNGA